MTVSLASTFGLSDLHAASLSGGTVQRVYEDLRKRIITLDLPEMRRRAGAAGLFLWAR